MTSTPPALAYAENAADAIVSHNNSATASEGSHSFKPERLSELDEDEKSHQLSASSSIEKLTSPPPLAAGPAPASRLIDYFVRGKKDAFDLDAVATQASVYDDPDFAKQYQPHPQWENNHRFDPNFRWTWREERDLVRKLDMRIALWAFIMFFSLDLDRENM